MTARIRLRPAHQQAASLADLEDVSMTFASARHDAPVEVLSGISLSVRPGELACVAGRSGSGKSTLLAIAASLLRPTTGVVRWLGSDVTSMSEDARRAWRRDNVGLVFQSGGLIDSLTAIENVALAAIPRSVNGGVRDRALLALGIVGIADRGEAFPGQLSGGEQQRVGIARALFSQPSLLIVDEPTANLDRKTADDIIGLLVNLSNDGAGILVATHDGHLIDRATRVLELE